MDDKRFRSDRGRDPIAELARLIAKADTHDESVLSDNRAREESLGSKHPSFRRLQLTVGLYEHEQGCERDEHCYGVQAHDIDDQPYAAEEEYPDSESLLTQLQVNPNTAPTALDLRNRAGTSTVAR